VADRRVLDAIFDISSMKSGVFLLGRFCVGAAGGWTIGWRDVLAMRASVIPWWEGWFARRADGRR